MSLMNFISFIFTGLFVSQLQAQSFSDSSTLTLYVYPSTNELNWGSPRSALLSFAQIEAERMLTKNDLVKFESELSGQGSLSSNYKSTMGHTLAHVQCRLPDGSFFDRWNSFSGQNYTSIDKTNLLVDKIGLGIFYYNYPDGHIIVGEENVKRLVHYKGGLARLSNGELQYKRPRYLKVNIDAQACLRLQQMMTYFESFHFPTDMPVDDLLRRPPEKTLYFNATSDPYDVYQQYLSTGKVIAGGGCAPYGVALLKMAGFYRQEFEHSWKLDLKISERLIGGILDSQTGEMRQVSIGELIFGGAGSSWEHANYPTRHLEIFDPSKIWAYIGNQLDCLKNKVQCVSESRNFELGPTQTFLDSVRKIRTTQLPELGSIDMSSGSEEYYYEEVKQKVEGVVLRN